MTARRSSVLARLGAPEPAPPWSVPAAVGSVLAAFLAVVAGTVFVQAWLPARPSTLLAGWTIAGLLMTLFVFQTRRDAGARAALRLGAAGGSLPFLLVIGIGAAMLLDLVGLALTGRFVPLPELAPLAAAPDDTFAWIIAAVLMVVAQPVGEELIFRGVVQPALRARLGPWPGLLLTALAYGLFHLAAYTTGDDIGSPAGLWYGLALPALDGVVFGAVRAAGGSTRAAILAHAAFGVFALLKVLMLAR